MDNVRRFVFVVMRAILSVTPRLMVLMRLDLFFAGVPNWTSSPTAFILRGGGERALLPTTNLASAPRGKESAIRQIAP